jgi:dipeptidyl aminopeptidase/acylaminoacyl peptidase
VGPRQWIVAAAVLAGRVAAAQVDTISPGDNLVLDGIPKISASIATAASGYTESRSADFQGWHPMRREILITTRFADTTQVHRVRGPMGARTQMTFFPDRVQSASYQPTRGDYFIFSKDVGGGEFFQIYRYDLTTGVVTLLTDGTSRNTGGTWSTRGDRIAYSSTRRNGRDTDIYVMNPADPASDRRLVELEGGGWSAADWSPDDTKIVVREARSINEVLLWLVEVRSGEKRLLTPKGEAAVAYGTARFTRDGKGLYVTTDRESEFMRLAYVDLATSRHRYLTTRIPWDVEDFDLTADGKTIAFVANEEGVSVLRLLDTATGKERRGPKLPSGVISDLAWHRNGTDLGFSFSHAQSPSDVYSWNPSSGRLERWTESETGGLPATGFAQAELVRWRTFDGRTISGFLYRPLGEGRRPVVVNIHGGPESQARPRFLGRQNYLLNELGVALLFPNVRGSSGFGKTFVKLDNGRNREDSVKDIGALLDWIATRQDLDSDRVMITGGSYGGYMTLASAAQFNDRIRCSLDVVGISNFVTFLERTEAYRRDLRRVEYGDERDPAMREFLQSISPLTNAGRIAKPLFVVQGQNDPRVSYKESEQIVGTVKANGGPVWFLMAKDEGHGFAKKKNQDFQFYASVEFIKEFLLH